VRFQLSLSQEPEQPDEQTTAFVDAPADLVPGTYEGGLKTWECALDLAAYLDRDVLNAQAGVTAAAAATAGRRIRGSRVLEVSSSIRLMECCLLLSDALCSVLCTHDMHNVHCMDS
jgi:protein-histidine N-methyltransferase